MTDPLTILIQQFTRLPGIGEKTATRLGFYILSASTTYANDLAQAILDVKHKLRPCSTCFFLSDQDPCTYCTDPRRDSSLLCVIALPQDLMAIERTANFHGRYHVLHGVLSPLDGVGPEELRIRPLLSRLAEGAITEVILATSPTVEGDATALYLSGLIRPLGIRVTRIASGIPIGGDLEYADGVTLNRALESRREF